MFTASNCKKNPVEPPPPPANDTTSHAWTFTISFLGDGNGSALYDISIVNDTLAYAAGAVYKEDSSGNWGINPYNLVKYDGIQWNLKQVKVSFYGNTIVVPLQGVNAFSSTQIWLAGSLPIYGSDSTWQMYDLRTTLNPNIDVSKTWGVNPQQMYFVGLSGSIVSCFNGNWQKITSGTTLNVQDIYGSNSTILAVASNPGESLDKQILQINGTTVSQLSINPIQQPLSSVWFVPGHYYVVGQGIYEKTSLSDPVWQQDSIDTVDFFSCIRGNAWNDFFVAGGYGQLLHFNGKSWQSYQNVLGMEKGAIARIAVKGNLMIAVGQLGSNAVAIVGRRQD
jgi:hypothetical protein